MSVFHSLLPGSTPPEMSGKSELNIFRERLLQSILLFIAGFGFIVYIPILYTLITSHQWLNAIFLSIALAIIIATALIRKLPFELRTNILLTMAFGSGIWAFIQASLIGNGRVLFLAFVVLTTIFLGLRSGIIALVFSILTMLAFSSGSVILPLQVPIISQESQSEWVNATLVFTLLGSMSTISLGVLLNSLDASLAKQTDLSNELAHERISLEQTVLKRTKDTENKLVQIRTTAEISRAISSVLDPQTLLQQVVELVRERFNLYYAGVFLVDPSGAYAVLKAGTGEAGQKMLKSGHRLSIGGSSMIGWAVANHSSRIALDVGNEAVRFNNPYLPKTRSELALPILSRDKALGALTIQSMEPYAFDEDNVLILQGIADSLAIALENANLYQQSQQDLDEIRALNRTYLKKSWQDLMGYESNLEYTYESSNRSESQTPLTKMDIPITLRDQIIGKVELESELSELSADDIKLIDEIANQTALALENARLLEETQRRASQDEKINELSVNLSRAFTIEDILKTALKELSQLPAVTDVSVHLSPPAEDLLQPIKLGGNGNGNGKGMN
ncbi:MAG: GAF domain-containing protein [Anaerolineaceae bacterium]|nr:GAF domain-containing protein [Anaerolineaceae bacterium]